MPPCALLSFCWQTHTAPPPVLLPSSSALLKGEAAVGLGWDGVGVGGVEPVPRGGWKGQSSHQARVFQASTMC